MMKPLIDQFLEIAGRHSDHLALIHGDKRISYARLENLIAQLSVWFDGLDCTAGDRIGIHCPNSIEYIAAYYACWYRGLVPVGLNSLASDREIAFWVSDAGCRLVLGRNSEMAVSGVPWHRIQADSEWIEIDGERLVGSDSTASCANILLDDVATIIYTSGTTGNPKGVALTHRNLATNIAAIVESLDIVASDRFLCVLPFFYSYGNSVLHSHLCVGASLVLLDRTIYPEQLLGMIEYERCSGFAGVPSLFLTLLKKARLDRFDSSSLRYVTQAGGPLTPEAINEVRACLPDVDFIVMYGQTEASSRISCLPANRIEDKSGSVGLPVGGLDIEIMDASGRPCLSGEKGEICVRGDSVMQGYWRNKEATRKVLVDGWLHTGDIGYLDSDGFLYIEGRQSEILKISEHRVSPHEIEEVLTMHESVEECAVVGCPHEQTGQFVRAYVVCVPGAVEERDLKRFCKGRLASYKIPKQILFVDAIPKTTSGKIKRGCLSRDEIHACAG